MRLDDLDSEQMLKVKQTWKSFGNIWSKGEAKGVQFVAEAVQRELGVDFDIAFAILSEYEREILRRERNKSRLKQLKRTPHPSPNRSRNLLRCKIKKRLRGRSWWIFCCESSMHRNAMFFMMKCLI